MGRTSEGIHHRAYVMGRTSEECSEKCAENGACDMEGICLFGCVGPFFGDGCAKPCNENCAENKTCFINGTCKFGCVASFYGEQCTKKCGENCAGDKSCSTPDGKCMHGCVAPFFGQLCTKNPFHNPYCVGGLTNQNQRCEHGCVPPYIGDSCNLLGLPRDHIRSKTWACHCNDVSCMDEKESCMSVDSCLLGWFGYSCNYRDIVVSAKVTDQSLNDNKINTCFEAANNTVYAEWNKTRKISWLWITFEKEG
ncbi:hypothetical protein Btru_039584 [Bulinus truncatus]|nr:hypothetical protein Btru_039584 [Bulinus truncatus]